MVARSCLPLVLVILAAALAPLPSPVHAGTSLRSLPASFDAWPVFETVRVMPTALPPAGPTVSGMGEGAEDVSLAQNEAESFQIALRRRGVPTTDLTAVNVATTARDLPPGLQVTWKQVGFVYVEHIYDNPQGAGGSWWPDPLLPRPDGVARVIGNMTCSLWFDVKADASTPPGTYTFAVDLAWTVTTTHGTPHTPQRQTAPFKVSVRVFDFALPATLTLKTAFDLSQPMLNSTYHLPPGPALHDTWMEYARFVLREYRLNPGTIYAAPALITVDEAKELTALGMNHFTIASVPNSVEEAKGQAAGLVDHVRALDQAGLGGMCSVYGFDEADQVLAANITAVFAHYKSMFPRVATVTTAHMQVSEKGHSVQDPARIRSLNVDHFCPVLDWVVPANMTKCLDEGLAMWFYTSCQPYLPWTNVRLDNPLLDARTLFWLSSLMGVDGFLYWGFNAWPVQLASLAPIDEAETGVAGLLLDPAEWTAATCRKCDGCLGECWEAGLENLQGDGKLIYAGTRGPVGSIRLAAVRDGLEDSEYLALLQGKSGRVAVLEALAGIVAVPYTKHTSDAAELAARRRGVAALLERTA